MPSRVAAVIVLAAGEGTRMKSATPKVLHALGGRTMLGHVLAAAEELQPEHLLVVVGHAREQVAATLTGKAKAVVQETQDGTGHAVRVALETLGALDGTVVVVPGDAPLLTGATLAKMVQTHAETSAATTLLTARVADPTGYGRVTRDATGVTGVVEHKDATDEQRAIDEVATSVYAFAAGPLTEALGQLKTDNAQGEQYLTDVVGIHKAAGLTVSAEVAADADETRGVNDRVQLAQLARILRDRIVEQHQRNGVAVLDPQTTWIDAGVQIEADTTIAQNTQLHGATVIGRGAVIGPDTTLTDTEVGEDAKVLKSHVTGARLGAASSVGPYAFVRAGTVLGARGKLGGFVEAKKAVIGDDSKVPHLAYVGDVTIGERSNIGAGTIVANFDGQAKHVTTIGDDVRIGSNNSLVAPVTIGDGVYSAAVTAITEDVPDDALVVRGGKQRTIEGRGASGRTGEKK